MSRNIPQDGHEIICDQLLTERRDLSNVVLKEKRTLSSTESNQGRKGERINRGGRKGRRKRGKGEKKEDGGEWVRQRRREDYK